MQTLPSHRQNTNFGLRYFLAGSSFTPDGAWAKMYAQKIDQEAKIKHSRGQILDRQADILENQLVLEDPSSTEVQKLRAQAQIYKLESSLYTFEMNLEGAKQELAEIQSIMEELEPLCKYRDLPVLERMEAFRREEWELEIKHRAECQILGNRLGLPAEEINTARQHPDFLTKIFPHMLAVGAKFDEAAKISHTNPEEAMKLVMDVLGSLAEETLKLTHSLEEIHNG